MKVVILFGCFLNLLSLNCVEIDHQQKNILNCQGIGMVLIQSKVLCPISSASEDKLQLSQGWNITSSSFLYQHILCSSRLRHLLIISERCSEMHFYVTKSFNGRSRAVVEYDCVMHWREQQQHENWLCKNWLCHWTWRPHSAKCRWFVANFVMLCAFL